MVVPRPNSAHKDEARAAQRRGTVPFLSRLWRAGLAAGFEPLHQESCPIGPAAIVPREVRWQIVRRTPAGPTAGYQLLMQRFELTQPASQSLTHTESGRARNATKWGRFVHKDLVSVSSARSHRSSRTVGELSRRERLAGNADPVRPLRRPRRVRR